jgi:DNA-binding response OmpR family regulator
VTDRLTAILVVDDEPDIASSMEAGLERRGFEVVSFTSAKEALAKYVPGRYHLLIVDIRMPGMDGFEFARQIRKRDADVKIRFLTAFDITKAEFQKSVPDMEYTDILQKPMLMEQLAAAIRSALGSLAGATKSLK